MYRSSPIQHQWNDQMKMKEHIYTASYNPRKKDRDIYVYKFQHYTTRWTMYLNIEKRCIQATLELGDINGIPGVWAGYSIKLEGCGLMNATQTTGLWHLHRGKMLDLKLPIRNNHRPPRKTDGNVSSDPPNVIITVITLHNYTREAVEWLLLYNEKKRNVMKWPQKRRRKPIHPNLHITMSCGFPAISHHIHVNKEKLLKIVARGESPFDIWCTNYPETDVYFTEVDSFVPDECIALFLKFVHTNYISREEIDQRQLVGLVILANHFAIDSLLALCALKLLDFLQSKELHSREEARLLHLDIPGLIFTCHKVNEVVQGQIEPPNRLVYNEPRDKATRRVD